MIATLNNTGTIKNGLHEASAPGGGYAIDSSGAIGALDNSGLIDGGVRLAAGAVDFANSGRVDGAIVLGGSASLLDNSGAILGTVSLAAGDTLLNAGLVTGAISAAANDVFELAPGSGNLTITGFIAGSGAGHDTIEALSRGWGGSTGPVSTMAQVGADVVIAVAGGGTITLDGVGLASLTAADFAGGPPVAMAGPGPVNANTGVFAQAMARPLGVDAASAHGPAIGAFREAGAVSLLAARPGTRLA